MADKSVVDKDLKEIGKKVGLLSYSYEDMHNDAVNSEYHYDYKRLIHDYGEMKNITPSQAEIYLVQCGILEPLPGGEFKIEFGDSTENGGGINYNSERQKS